MNIYIFVTFRDIKIKMGFLKLVSIKISNIDLRPYIKKQFQFR